MTPMLLAAWRRRPNASHVDTIMLVVHDVVLRLEADEVGAQFKLVTDEPLIWWQNAKDDFPGNTWWTRIL